MPAAILLGTGYLPEDLSKRDLLDVHLHLDHPEQPISFGVRWGNQSTGTGLTLEQATTYMNEAHLRACGCEWLRMVAIEQQFSGRKFTPEEILQRRPDGAVAPPPAPLPATPKVPSEPVLERIGSAITAHDFEAIEGLRDVLNSDLLRAVAAEWNAQLDWETKDAYCALLLDFTDDAVRPIFRDALDSPTVESRAYAVCVLTKDFSRFDDFLVGGGVDESRVDAAVAALKSGPHPDASRNQQGIESADPSGN